MGWFSKKKDPPKEENNKKIDDNQKRNSLSQKKENHEVLDQQNQDQLISDSILQYVTSPDFRKSMMNFLDQNCIFFLDQSSESMKLYDDIHMNFKSHVEEQLTPLQETIGINKQTLLKQILQMLKEPSIQKYLNIMIMYYHLGEFIKIMMQRNKKLGEVAHNDKKQDNLNQMGNINQYQSVSKQDMNFVVRQSVLDQENHQQRQKMLKQREEDEYERAILESKKWYEDYLRRLEQEEEDLRRALLLSLEYMRQQGLKESEKDKREREEQEKKLQEEKERAKQEIQRLELENQRIQQEKQRRIKKLNEQNQQTDLQQSQLMKINQERLQSIELEKQRQKQLEEEEKKLKDLNEQKQRDMLLQQEEMKRKLLENQERVRKMKEEEQMRKQKQQEEEEYNNQKKQQQNQSAQNQEQNTTHKTDTRLMDAIKQQLKGKQQKINNDIEQELGYHYDENDNNDMMNQYISQSGQILNQNDLLMVAQDQDNNSPLKNQQQFNRQNKNNYSSNKNKINNNNNGYDFDDDGEREQENNQNKHNQNPYQLNPKQYDKNTRKNFFADLKNDPILRSQLQSNQSFKPKNNQQSQDNSSGDDEDEFNSNANKNKNKLEDQFDELFKDINDLDIDRGYGRDRLDDPGNNNRKISGVDDDTYASVTEDANQRRERAIQQRAELLNLRKQQMSQDQYQSIRNKNNSQSNNTYGNRQNDQNQQYQSNQTNGNQNVNRQYSYNRQESSHQSNNMRDESYGISRDQKIPIKFADVGKATIQNRTQF